MSLVRASTASRWEWISAVLLAAGLAATLLCNGGYGARVEGLVSLGTVVLAAVHGASRVMGARAGRPLHPAGWFPLPFIAYAAIHVAWLTPVPWLGQRDLALWVQMAVVFWIVLNGVPSRAPRRLVFLTLVAVALVGVVAGCYQVFVEPGWRFFGGSRVSEQTGRATGTFSLANSFAGLLLLVLPAVAARVLRPATATSRVWWIWVGLVLAVGLVLTLSRGAWLSLATALAVSPLLAARLTWRRRVLGALAIVAALCLAGWMIGRWMPAARERVAQAVTDGGERTRPFMWEGAWRLWLDAPVLGNGAGSYNALFERHRAEGFRDEPLWAHNEYLNLLADYGLAGAMLAGGGVMMIMLGCRRSFGSTPTGDWMASGLGAGLLAFALQMAFEFHLKLPGLAWAAAAAGGLAVARFWPVAEWENPRAGRRWPWVLVACGLMAAWALVERPRTSAEALRAPARAAIDGLASSSAGSFDYARVVPHARDDLAAAVRLHPGNAQAWADLAYATTLMAFVSPEQTSELGRQAEAAAGAALRLCPVIGEFWARRGDARDLQGIWAEAGGDFARAVELSPADAVMWYRYGAHLARRPAGREAAQAAVEFCLRLDPSFSEGLRLRQRLQQPTRP